MPGTLRGSGGTLDVSACRFAETLMAATFGVRLPDLRLPRRGLCRVAQARQAAMYLIHVTRGLTLTEVGAHFSRDRTTVAHGCALTEERRDEQAYDRLMECLEFALLRWIGAFAGARP
ncbi:helix-turn-helix domain-containing protein [Afifella sp. IM 167]|uniref:helix-turn-helix domain-containing protein n=1 Tax=Afifella sp. IM 167 TaxID=2033586 RepID=UPI001CCC1F11|nr:helix-turn-helix domain-containing protein [Afifella sp. IM 167]